MEAAADDSPALPISAACEVTLPLGDGISLWYTSTRSLHHVLATLDFVAEKILSAAWRRRGEEA
eukprot:COSAG02_NODE_5811_length_4021_cov_7.199133_4_plen_64_part_00